MKNILIVLVICFSFQCNAQIVLNGYKCCYQDEIRVGIEAAFCNKHDTILYMWKGRDIVDAIDTFGPITNLTKAQLKVFKKAELKAALEFCFIKYYKTKDDLYYDSGKFPDGGGYYYTVYDPVSEVAIKLCSNYNDREFSEKSKWLLSQIRKHRNPKNLYLINEKGRRCDAAVIP